MRELRVPTVAVPAHIVCADGRELNGRLFVPAAASRHSGPMRAQEWLNEPFPFFAFEHGEGGAVLLNKYEIVVITMDAEADAGDVAEGVEMPEYAVRLECGSLRLAGKVAIDMPPSHCRVIDYLNFSDPFLTLRDGPKHHLVRKQRITLVVVEPVEPERKEGQ